MLHNVLRIAFRFACVMSALLHVAQPRELPAQSANARPIASLFANVVSVRAGNQQGFGFIVGLRRDTAFIATPLHVVESDGGQNVQLCFAPGGATCARATLVYIADAIGQLPALDLAFLAVPLPSALPWRPDVEAPSARIGDEVRTIGRSGEWYVPPNAGRVASADPVRGSFTYAGLDVMSGVSGAPVASAGGMVGMHTQGRGAAGADGLLLATIRARFEAFAPGAWALVPPAKCAGEAETREALGGRAVVVRFLPGGQRVALEAAARLACVGAIVQLAPQRAGEAWAGPGVVYPPGELPKARAVQALLAELGRMPGVLGVSGGVIEVRVPG